MEQYNLFVYGSLRPNFFNFEKYLEGKTLDIKPAVLKNMDLYHMPYKGYPAITKGTGVVVGEIITVKDYDSTVKAIDIMEGFLGENNPNNEYHKILLEVNHLNSKKNVIHISTMLILIKTLMKKQSLSMMVTGKTIC